MPNLCSRTHCTGCSACAQACPRRCIAMSADGEGFLYPQIDAAHCVECGRCRDVCPVLRSSSAEKPLLTAMAAHSTDNDTLAASSSGGVFTLLAQCVLEEGGVVFGAAFDGVLTVRHIAVETVEGLEALRGSKYLQSIIGDSYCQAKQALDTGRKVLFSGTPCQVAALRSYLGKDYANLLCVDIICHSVPSPKVWQTYLTHEERLGHKAVGACFRDKRDSWKRYYLCVRLSDGKESLRRGNENYYMKAFIQGLSTRPSCHQCKFKAQNRDSDITLGDFWGVETVCPEAFHEEGTSLVLIQSTKGQAAFDEIAQRLDVCRVDPAAALQGNPAYSVPSKPHRNRNDFFCQLGREPLEDLVERLLAPTRKEICLQKWNSSFLCRGIRKMKRMFVRRTHCL